MYILSSGNYSVRGYGRLCSYKRMNMVWHRLMGQYFYLQLLAFFFE
jgi:hypothetical protein